MARAVNGLLMERLAMSGYRALTVSALIYLLAACAAPSTPLEPVAPLVGSTTAKGKGVPNGSSDSNEVFATLQGASSDSAYGRTTANPIRVGSDNLRQGPMREKLFLNALRGPAGEPIAYERMGSCCEFKTSNGIMGTGLLDVFRVIVAGRPEPVTLYINMYDPGPALAPTGFTTRPKYN
jgi:hypothetical protein